MLGEGAERPVAGERERGPAALLLAVLVGIVGDVLAEALLAGAVEVVGRGQAHELRGDLALARLERVAVDRQRQVGDQVESAHNGVPVRRMFATRRLFLVVLAIVLTLPGAALAHTPSPSDGFLSGGTNVPLAMSPNVTLHSSFPETTAISGEFARTGEYFYVSSADSITVFDTTDQRRPKLVGYLGNLVFENEAMSYGERVRRRRAAALRARRQRSLGRRGRPAHRPRPRPPRRRRGDRGRRHRPARPARALAHAGERGGRGQHQHAHRPVPDRGLRLRLHGGRARGVLDRRHARPRPPAPGQDRAVDRVGAVPVFTSGAGHYWDFDAKGIGWHTGSGGAAAFDVSDPLNPRRLNGTDAHGTQTPWNDFIHHNSMRPNAGRFQPGRAPRLSRGNVLLVTEEDYANDGDELVCDKAGTFQTWEVPDLAGGADRSGRWTSSTRSRSATG